MAVGGGSVRTMYHPDIFLSILAGPLSDIEHSYYYKELLFIVSKITFNCIVFNVCGLKLDFSVMSACSVSIFIGASNKVFLRQVK